MNPRAPGFATRAASPTGSMFTEGFARSSHLPSAWTMRRAARRRIFASYRRMSGGVSVDFGVDAAFIPDAAAAAIHSAYPRISIGRALADAVAAQARRNPAKAPPFSMPAQLFMERTATPHLTTVEQLAQGGRWND